MSETNDTRLLALLVHRGLLPVDVARTAMTSADPARHLIDSGAISAEQWNEWRRTEAGTRPVLTRYRVGDLLGEGGTARVFRAVDQKTGETVALKVLKAERAADRAALDAFISESRLLMELDCENIVKGLRVAREGDTFFCAMQCIEGVCLQDEVDEGRPLDPTLALRVVMQIGRALSYLHGRGLVHRDVKPGNIMLTPEGRAVLIDLGFAVKAAGDAAERGATRTETTAGTVHYISPEQARGQGALDARADIYSLGASLYHLVTGSLPFEGESHDEIMAKQVREALSGNAIRKLGLSPQVHYFIEKMMAKEKEIRFQTPDELVDEIAHYLEAQEREAAARAEADRKTLPRRRRRRLR